MIQNCICVSLKNMWYKSKKFLITVMLADDSSCSGDKCSDIPKGHKLLLGRSLIVSGLQTDIAKNVHTMTPVVYPELEIL